MKYPHENNIIHRDDDNDNNDNELNNNDDIATNESVNSEFKPSSDLIDLVFNSFDRSSTMFKLSRLCRAVSKYVHLFSTVSSKGSSITQEAIVKFATDLLMRTYDFDVPKKLKI